MRFRKVSKWLRMDVQQKDEVRVSCENYSQTSLVCSQFILVFLRKCHGDRERTFGCWILQQEAWLFGFGNSRQPEVKVELVGVARPSCRIWGGQCFPRHYPGVLTLLPMRAIESWTAPLGVLLLGGFTSHLITERKGCTESVKQQSYLSFSVPKRQPQNILRICPGGRNSPNLLLRYHHSTSFERGRNSH